MEVGIGASLSPDDRVGINESVAPCCWNGTGTTAVEACHSTSGTVPAAKRTVPGCFVGAHGSSSSRWEVRSFKSRLSLNRSSSGMMWNRHNCEKVYEKARLWLRLQRRMATLYMLEYGVKGSTSRSTIKLFSPF